MPIYEYECNECNKGFEIITYSSNMNNEIRCRFCDGIAKKIISKNGAVHTDGDVKWLKSATLVLQPDGERPIETRGQYNRYLKDNGLVCKG